jgi:hypothetical protein
MAKLAIIVLFIGNSFGENHESALIVTWDISLRKQIKLHLTGFGRT